VCLAALVLILGSRVVAYADPGPGDIFREYIWRGPYVNAGSWQRVTHPGATAAGANAFLPNPVNSITIDDLTNAVGAEIYLEVWGGHAGTSSKAVRLNGHDWIPIAEPLAIPGNSGDPRLRSAECYQRFTYPSVAVPLDQLRLGDNEFEFSAGPQICFNFGWGQWGLYAAAFRIYYDDDKPHPTGRIVAPAPGSTFSDSLTLEAVVSSPNGAVERVDFIGSYEDFDYEGNGVYRQWHYRYRYGVMQNQLGTATEAPYAAVWSTAWVPDQPGPMKVMARITDTSGISHMTQPVAGLILARPGRAVKLYKPFDVAPAWQTRVGNRHSSKLFVGDDLERATAAQMMLVTWSGGDADAIGINDSTVVKRVGRTHNYSLDAVPVPLELVRQGTNTLFTYAKTVHHGIEVMWPGIALLVQYTNLQGSAPPVADLLVFGDELAADWRLDRREQTGVELTADLVFAGRSALRVTPAPGFIFYLDMIATPPVRTTGYRSLHLAFLAQGVEMLGLPAFKLYVNEKSVELHGGSFHLDFDSRHWQEIEIPLDDLELRFPYIETLRLEGRLQGAFLLDDVRLVAEQATAIVEQGRLAQPSVFALLPNYPNPFNSGTTLRFVLAQAGDAQLSVYDLLGQKVASVMRGFLPAGYHSQFWDGRDDDGYPLASGVYLCRLRTKGHAEIRSLVLLR
jgi:hypothetical protein